MFNPIIVVDLKKRFSVFDSKLHKNCSCMKAKGMLQHIMMKLGEAFKLFQSRVDCFMPALHFLLHPFERLR